MTEQEASGNDNEALRLAVERARLAIEHAESTYSRQRLFYERWRTNIDPLHEGAERSREMAFAFAKMALQTVFFLHGGAMLAFPAFAELAGAGLGASIGWALAAFLSFILGLASVTIATLSAYQAMDADSHAGQKRVLSVKHGFNAEEAGSDVDRGDYEYEKEQKEAEKAALDHYAKFGTYSRRAVVLGVIALVLFVIGAFCAGVVLWSAAPQ